MRKSFLILICFLLIFSGCSKIDSYDSGAVYLYGESHGNEKVLDKELEIWQKHYDLGYRHLFVELAYYHGELLNLWMQSNDDKILNELFEDWQGTAGYNEYSYNFYKSIKESCPETIFHGTDIGHQYETSGQRYLKYLEENGFEDSEKYEFTLKSIKQGEIYYRNNNRLYREKTMTENFIREFESLDGKSVVGFYGASHTDPKASAYGTKDVPCMAKRLYEKYGNSLHTKSLVHLA